MFVDALHGDWLIGFVIRALEHLAEAAFPKQVGSRKLVLPDLLSAFVRLVLIRFH